MAKSRKFGCFQAFYKVGMASATLLIDGMCEKAEGVIDMSVLTRLVEEREQYARRLEARHARRSRVIALEYVLMLALGALMIVYYNKIVTALVGLLKL